MGAQRRKILWAPDRPAHPRKELETMVSFSNDVDILKYEPVLFGELHLSGQVLVAGTGGTLNGTTFTANSADFVSAQVSAGEVVYLQTTDGALDGAYEIVSVDSATQLSVSVIRSSSDDPAVAPPDATAIYYRVCTFGPQADEVGFRLTEYFGIRPGNPASIYDTGDVLDTEVLKRASVFGIISIVYAMLASEVKDDSFWKKSLHYRKLFERARERCQLSIDIGSDGTADITKIGASVRLVRD